MATFRLQTRPFLWPKPVEITYHRSLRPSPRRHLVSEAINASHDALQSLHTVTGLPWALTLPLFAALLRTTFVLPLTIYQRRAALRQVQLQPLLSAWRGIVQKESMAKSAHLGPSVVDQLVVKAVNKKRRELYKRWGCGWWKNFLGFLQLPVFLSVMEALRRMSGSHQGILGMLPGPNTVVTTPETVDGVLTGDGLVVEAVRVPVEASLSTEGMLWFPDLLAADPYLILPFALSATILLNVFGGPRGQDLVLSKWQVRLKRNIGVVALMIGPIMLQVPSALLVYWISSSGLAFIQAMVLERVMPIKPPPKPCQSPTRWRTGIGRPSEQVQAP